MPGARALQLEGLQLDFRHRLSWNQDPQASLSSFREAARVTTWPEGVSLPALSSTSALSCYFLFYFEAV